MALLNRPTDLPVDQVKAMQAKGFDNNQIVQALQRNGYSSTQIFDAINQSELSSGADMSQGPPPPGPGMPPPPDGTGGYGDDQSGAQQEYAAQGASIGMGASNEEIEELVESVIEEKWDDLAKDINKIVEWKSDVETKINKLEERFEGLREEFNKVHQAIIGKIGEYDKNILTVGAEVKAMEKVFSKVLPIFTENVNELSRITSNIKKSSK